MDYGKHLWAVCAKVPRGSAGGQAGLTRQRAQACNRLEHRLWLAHWPNTCRILCDGGRSLCTGLPVWQVKPVAANTIYE